MATVKYTRTQPLRTRMAAVRKEGQKMIAAKPKAGPKKGGKKA